MLKAAQDSVEPLVLDEALRAAILSAYDVAVIDTDPQLDAIARFAAQLCGTPIGLVSLVEEERQRFLGREGLEATQTPRSTSFCQHAMLLDAPMEVPDAREDPRFAANPLVTGDPHIRFYAGAPLVSAEGVPLGALCVIDREPRPGLTPLQREGLTVLAAAVMARLAARRIARASLDHFRGFADSMPQMVWSSPADGRPDYFNRRWAEFTGSEAEESFGGGWAELVHEEDRTAAIRVWARAVATGEPYEIRYRLRHRDDGYRWVLARGLPVRGADGRITRWFGTCTDIDETVRLAEERDLVSRELSHRIKNIFAVVNGLILASARAAPHFADMARSVAERVAALGRAHDFVRPREQDGVAADGTTLFGLFRELFVPHATAHGDRIRVEGDDVAIDERAVNPLALIFHELATNAAKYGALSADEGEVRVRTERDGGSLRIRWREAGGPPVAGEPRDAGFGTRLIAMSGIGQLRGTLHREWRREGLEVTLTVPLDALVAAS